MKKWKSRADRDGARLVCPQCENDVWQSKDDSVFRLCAVDGRVEVAERLSANAPLDLDRIVCANCDFAFRWRDREQVLFDCVPNGALAPLALRDAIHEIRAVRHRLTLVREMLGQSKGRVPRQVRRAERALAQAARSIERKGGV